MFLHTSSLSQNEEGKLTSFLARACSAPSSMPNDLKYKAIVAESCRGVQVENTSSLREPAYPFISSYP